jgi:hypothetical protein
MPKIPPDQQSPYGPQPPNERRPDGDAEFDGLLVGGPWDAVPVRARDAAVVTFEADGLEHRYIRTTAIRDTDRGELVVYNYDGEVRR